MKKSIITILFILLNMLILTSCGASKKKIAEAQDTYRALISTHEQVLNAYNEIEDDSLRGELNSIVSKIEEIGTYDLNKMKDKDIDVLIDTMDEINKAYSEYLKTIGVIKVSEETTRLDRISFSLVNNTDETITGLYLKEQGETDLVTDALEGTGGLKTGETIVGLAVYRDSESTPWIMELLTGDDNDGKTYSIILDDSVISGDNVILSVKKDEMTGDFVLE